VFWILKWFFPKTFAQMVMESERETRLVIKVNDATLNDISIAELKTLNQFQGKNPDLLEFRFNISGRCWSVESPVDSGG
jgi:hypothetical protein